MASKFLHEARRGAKSGSIDLPLAVVAGLSVGFVAFMMPADILSRAVEISRLPEFLPAAAPPLGAKAHIALCVGAAGATFAAIYVLLRLLGRNSSEPNERVWPEADTEREPETPRLRRSDVHPDAPARRPILATRELGEPAPTARREERPAEPEAVPAAAGEEALELGGPGIEMLAPEPDGADVIGPVVSDAALDEPAVAAPSAEAPPTRQSEPEPVADASVAELMLRLERGLARRAQHKQAMAPPSPPPASATEPSSAAADEWGDDRLRSAIENLQKMAARAG